MHFFLGALRVNSLPTCFLSSAFFFQNQLFRKILSGIQPERQTVSIKIRPDILSGLIWVQTVCNGYQLTTQVGKEMFHLSTHNTTLPYLQSTVSQQCFLINHKLAFNLLVMVFWWIDINMIYVIKFQKLLSLCSQMLVIRAGIHKTFDGIANRENPDQTASSSLIQVCAVCIAPFLQLEFLF